MAGKLFGKKILLFGNFWTALGNIKIKPPSKALSCQEK